MRLTVVIDQFGNVDALDEPDDEIREGETAYDYLREKELGMMHRKMKHGGDFTPIATYYPANPKYRLPSVEEINARNEQI